MKVRTGLAIAAFAGALWAAEPAPAAEACAGKSSAQALSVQVLGLRAAKGEVAVTVYPDNAKRFLAPHGKILRQRVKAEIPATKACFFLPEAGFYAIAIYHDANADHDFNRNPIGMPSEGFGFSNDAPARFGVPSFESVRFRVKPGQNAMVIHMRYAR